MAKREVKRWHFTTFKTSARERSEIIEGLRKYASKWVFQLESAPTTGSLHFQGKVHLSVACKNPWNETDIPHIDHWSIEVKDNDKTGWTYVMKSATRVQGPWTDASEVWTPADWSLATLRPWQEEAIRLLHHQSKRQVLVVCDLTGSAGKTTFIKHLKVNYKALWVPSTLGTAKDIVRCVADLLERVELSTSHLICIDVPRGLTLQGALKWEELFAAVESIKDGMVCDDRYHFKQVFFKSPRVVMMVNHNPPADVLSPDRWVYLNPATWTPPPVPTAVGAAPLGAFGPPTGGAVAPAAPLFGKKK